MKIGEKEIVFNKYTRAIDRDYQIKLTEGTTINTSGIQQEMDSKIIANMQYANDFLVNKMTGLNQDEIDNLSIDEYNKIITEINKIKDKVPTQA